MNAISQAQELKLEPIVSQPLEAKIGSNKFTYSGYGLMSNGERLDPDARSKLPLLKPARTLKGTIKVHQPHIPKRSAGGGAHRGNVITEALRVLEGRLHAQFLVLNARERDEKWAVWDDETKIEKDPDRFLEEGFAVGTDREAKAVAVRTWRRYNLREAAARIDGLHQWENNPGHGNPNRWIVLARDENALCVKRAEIHQQEAKEAKQEHEAQVRRQADIESQRQKIVADIRKSGENEHSWNVAGEWIVELEAGLTFTDDEEGTMSIRVARNDSGLMQIYADFDFVDVTGVMRLVRSNSENASGLAREQTKTSGQDEEDYDEDDREHAACAADFDIPAHLGPGPEAPDWEFRWRGRETGESEIQLTSDENLCDISFDVDGTTCEGFLSGAAFSGISFSGSKIAAVDRPLSWGQGVAQVENEWNSLDAGAHEYARKGRWH